MKKFLFLMFVTMIAGSLSAIGYFTIQHGEISPVTFIAITSFVIAGLVFGILIIINVITKTNRLSFRGLLIPLGLFLLIVILNYLSAPTRRVTPGNSANKSNVSTNGGKKNV